MESGVRELNEQMEAMEKRPTEEKTNHVPNRRALPSRLYGDAGSIQVVPALELDHNIARRYSEIAVADLDIVNSHAGAAQEVVQFCQVRAVIAEAQVFSEQRHGISFEPMND